MAVAGGRGDRQHVEGAMADGGIEVGIHAVLPDIDRDNEDADEADESEEDSDEDEQKLAQAAE